MDRLMRRLIDAAAADEPGALDSLGRELGRRGHVPGVDCGDGRVIVIPELEPGQRLLFSVAGLEHVDSSRWARASALFGDAVGYPCVLVPATVNLQAVIQKPSQDRGDG